MQAAETDQKVTQTQKTVTSIETKEDKLRQKLDQGLQDLGNQISKYNQRLTDWFSELDLDGFLPKLDEIHRIIKYFDGTDDQSFLKNLIKFIILLLY